MFWICKMCGRSMKSEEKPSFCYFDRMDAIENISDEDAEKMGLKLGTSPIYEFPGDVRYNSHNGNRATLGPSVNGASRWTLSDFQDEIMERVRA
nr:hypothetical protein 2 [bacterium]